MGTFWRTNRLHRKENAMKRILVYVTLFTLIFSACTPLTDSEFNRNYEKWQMANISHYRFSLGVSCFCAFTQKMPLSIEVKDGQVVSMTYNDGSAVPDSEREFFARYETINALFDYTKGAMADADEIHIQYDSTYGFPSSVQIDFIKNAMDDELSLYVQSFERLN